MYDDGNVIPTAVKDIIGKVANKIVKAQFSDLLKMSSPALMHCSRTFLEGAAMDLLYSSRFLGRAATTQDPIERMKYIVCMYVGG